MDGTIFKITLSGRKQRANRPIFMGSFGSLKGVTILPGQKLSQSRNLL
jgi:hypothetical protein